MSDDAEQIKSLDVFRRNGGRAGQMMAKVIEGTLASGFDPDAYHVMDQRDTRLIQDELMSGQKSAKFIYNFSLAGSMVSGISVIGAREMASHYKGIKHRLVSSTRKIKDLFIFTTYAAPGVSPSMETRLLPELRDEPDGYEAVCEITDIKTGNSMMAAKFESQYEWSSKNKAWYEKPHFSTIAQAKAQRNGILMIIPQSVQIGWMESMRGMDKTQVITGSVLAEKRDGVLRYGAAHGIAIDREALEQLVLEQIAGLAEAARTKDKDAFLAAAGALGLHQTPKAAITQEQTIPVTSKKTADKVAAPTSDQPKQTEMTREEPPPREDDGFGDAE